jgi:hypothetical protein
MKNKLVKFMKQLKNQILMLEILQKKKQKEILILLLQLPPCKLSQVAN